MTKALSFRFQILLLFTLLIFGIQFEPAHAAPIDEAEPNNSLEEAQLVATIGAENHISARFSDATDVDWFKFEATQGETYVVELFNVAGATNTRGYSPGLRIYDPNSTKVKEAAHHISNGAGNTNQGLQFEVTLSGIHFIQVTHYGSYNAAGPYGLRILPTSTHSKASWDNNHEPNNYLGIAFPLEVGRTAEISTSIEARSSSYITNNHDRDWFRFEAVKDQWYVVETFNVAKSIQGNGYAMQLEILNSDLTKVAEDTSHRSNGGGNTNSSMSFQATQGGAYFIKLYPYNDSQTKSGPYSLRVLPQSDQAEASWDTEHEPNNWSVHAFPLKLGSTQGITTSIEKRNNSYIAENHDRDWFRFEAKEGVAYAIEIFNAAGAINGNGYAMQIEIMDSNFTEVAKRTDHRPNGGGTTNTGASFLATKGGTHYIKAYPYADNKTGSGPYSIRVLPHFSQEEASWDSNHEPNNWSLHAYELTVGREHALTTNIEPRSSSYLNAQADYDWFYFDAVAGAEYVVETFNAAGAINRRGYPLQLIAYDSDSTIVGQDTQTGSRTNGAGNVNASVGFQATKGGTYSILVYPYASEAGSGPYSIRVLPRYDQPAANWDAAFEPNNWRTHAAPLEMLPCGRRTTIEERNSSYLTHNADRDWFAVNVVEGQEYSLDLFDVSSRFDNVGLYLRLYDREVSKLFEERGTDIRHVFTANYTGIYFVWITPYNTNANGSYRIRVVPTDGEECPERPNPRVNVEGCASVGINPETGEVTLRGTPRSDCAQTITRIITCNNRNTPTDVNLTIGERSFAMSHSGNNRFSITINLSEDLPTGRGPFAMSVTRTCPGQVSGQDSITVGEFVLFDPSGVIRNSATNQPIKGATVTLYRGTDLVPDTDGQNGNCRTVNTNGGSWDLLPMAQVDQTQAIDPLLDSINNIVQISPTINPQVTGQDGSYAWDVVEGCWYIVVEAEGYIPVSSPLVGVPPAVTDLDIQLARSKQMTYLPLVQK